MRARARRVVALLAAVASATPLVVLISAAPASASPVGYTLLVEFIDDDAVDGDTGIQQIAECTLAQIDLATGTVTPLPDTSEEGCVDDLTLAPDGRVFGIQQQCEGVIEVCATGSDEFDALQGDAEVHLIVFDPTTGAPTDLGAIDGPAVTSFIEPSPLAFGGLTFDKNGNLYVEMVGDDPPCDFSFFCLYKVDPADPSNTTFVGFGPATEPFYQVLAAGCGTPEAVTLEPTDVDGGTTGDVGGVALPVGDQDLLSRDLATGGTTVIGPVGEDNALTGMAFESNGVLWGIGFTFTGEPGPPTASVFTVNTTTGLATPTADTSFTVLDGLLVGLALPLDCPPEEALVVAFTG